MRPRIFGILALCSLAFFVACAAACASAVASPENALRITTNDALTG